MIERRKTPRTEIRKNSQVFNRPGLSADRPRRVDVQGHHGPEQSAAGARDQSRWLGDRLTPERAPETSSVRNVKTVDARLRAGIRVIVLAAVVVSTVVVSTNVLGLLLEVGGSIRSRLRTSAVIARQSFNVETLPSLTKPNKIEWSRSDGEKIASPGNRVASLDRPCVRPEVHRAASDRGRFFWLLRDKHDRIVEESPITYVSDTAARSAADDAATGHACNTRVTATRGRENL